VNTNRFCRALILLAALASGCSRPSADDRDNRRLLEQILTAITLRNGRLLEASARRTGERHDRGLLAEQDYQAIEAFIDKARRGDWSGSEAAGYAFRKKHPFVEPGQR
jgi:hypothetical protein